MKTGLKTLFQFLGIVENHQLRLEVSREKFIELLKAHVGYDGNSTMDIFSSGKIDYKGVVGQTGFYVRRTRGLLNNTRHFCKAIGTFREENNQLVIDLEFKNFPPGVWMYLFLVFFFGLGSVVMFLTSLLSFNLDNISRYLFNVFSMVVISTLLGLVVRTFSAKTIQQMKFELENNINRYLTTKS